MRNENKKKSLSLTDEGGSSFIKVTFAAGFETEQGNVIWDWLGVTATVLFFSSKRTRSPVEKKN